MNKTTETYLHSFFIDYKGRIHNFTICALVYPSTQSQLSAKVTVYNNNTNEVVDEIPLERNVSIGYAICNPVDNYDEKQGMKLAKQRAIENPKRLFSEKSGIINSVMIEGLLQQEANFIKNNPGCFIHGYTADKRKYFINLNNKKKEYTVNETVIKNIIRAIADSNGDIAYKDIIRKVFQ